MNGILQNQKDVELVIQFILEHRGSGHFLPYNDYEIVREWIKASPHIDVLLLTLADLLPVHYQDVGKKTPRTLAGMRRKVLGKLQGQTALTS